MYFFVCLFYVNSINSFYFLVESSQQKNGTALYTRVIDKRQEGDKKITSLLYLPIKKDKEKNNELTRSKIVELNGVMGTNHTATLVPFV